MWFWVLLDIMIGAIAIAILFAGIPFLGRFASSLPATRTITVTAEGKTTASPDLATIDFSVVTQGANPSDLSTNNNDKMNAVLQFVSSQNIATSDMKTTSYDLQPNYQYDKNNSRTYIASYTLTQTVDVKIHDLKKVADVLAGLAPLGVNQIGGVNFSFNDPNQFLNIARADALNKAKTQAAEMSSEAGAHLGAVVNVSESGNIPYPRPYYSMDSAASGIGMKAAVAPSIQPGTQDITDSVTVTYELE